MKRDIWLSYEETWKLGMILNKWRKDNGLKLCELAELTGYKNAKLLAKGRLKHVPKDKADAILELIGKDNVRHIASEFNWKEIPYYAS